MFTTVRAATLFSLSLLTLTACEDGQGLNLGGPSSEGEITEAVANSEGPQSVLKDVERPDIFNVSELALWDGRPSLGGVWVAHPDITTPERVILTNVKNGKTIPGALFRRERENPGPRIQVSSDAAGALGMLAGQPVELKVLVVRQEEVEIEPTPLPVSDETEDTLSTEELAAAGVVDDADAGETPAVEDTPKRPNFFQRLFRKKPAAEVSAAGAATAATVDTVDDASAPAVETTSLDPVSTGAAAAIARSESSQAPQPRPESAAAPAPASTLKNPYIQVGQFSVEANADAASASLRQSGIIPTVTNTENGDWRVVIGPVSTADDQAALLAQVKKLGYTDAFLAPR
jgi:cell division protein FtsN